MRAAIYCRISQDATGEALGVARQLEDCTKTAEAAGWIVTEVYSDNDISASSGKPRPEYRRMLKAIEAGDVDAIVAWAPDRLYRKLADLEELIPLVEKHGTAIRTCRAGDFDLATPLGKMIARILGAVATGEGDVKSDRWKRSVRQRREAGMPPKMGPRLYGYDENAQVIGFEAAIIREAANRVLDGEPLTRIANNLNTRGILTSRGNPWKFITLNGLLTNGRLAGHSTLRGETIGVGTWEPILDPEMFEALQVALSRPKAKGRPDASPRVALLVGLVECGTCHAKLVTGRRYPTGKPSVRIYRCPVLPGVDACGGVSADAEAVERIVETYAREKFDEDRVRDRLATLGEMSKSDASELVGLEQRLVDLEAELDSPGVPVPAILRAMDRTKQRIGELHASSGGDIAILPLRGDWPIDLARRAKLIRLVVARVAINPGKALNRAFDPRRVDIDPR